MAKIVYNACFGGFGLSEKAVLRYCEIKGLTCFPEKKNSIVTTYWLAPPNERAGILSDDEFHERSQEERAASNARYRELTLDDGKISRHEPALVQVVEELGAEANGPFANLQIEELESGALYRIDEYDGNESVMTNDDYDWTVAP